MAETAHSGALFAAGCFWAVEAAFRRLDGVLDTAVGYCGGSLEAPSYAQVCTGATGHAETVWVAFDPAVISYRALLETFWTCHDPTQRDRQGPDIGVQYRSVIFVQDAAQREAALESRRALSDRGRWPRLIVTATEPAAQFWRAEEEHQRYLEKHRGAYC